MNGRKSISKSMRNIHRNSSQPYPTPLKDTQTCTGSHNSVAAGAGLASETAQTCDNDGCPHITCRGRNRGLTCPALTNDDLKGTDFMEKLEPSEKLGILNGSQNQGYVSNGDVLKQSEQAKYMCSSSHVSKKPPVGLGKPSHGQLPFGLLLSSQKDQNMNYLEDEEIRRINDGFVAPRHGLKRKRCDEDWDLDHLFPSHQEKYKVRKINEDHYRLPETRSRCSVCTSVTSERSMEHVNTRQSHTTMEDVDSNNTLLTTKQCKPTASFLNHTQSTLWDLEESCRNLRSWSDETMTSANSVKGRIWRYSDRDCVSPTDSLGSFIDEIDIDNSRNQDMSMMEIENQISNRFIPFDGNYAAGSDTHEADRSKSLTGFESSNSSSEDSIRTVWKLPSKPSHGTRDRYLPKDDKYHGLGKNVLVPIADSTRVKNTELTTPETKIHAEERKEVEDISHLRGISLISYLKRKSDEQYERQLLENRNRTEKFTKVDQTEKFTKVDQTEKFTEVDQAEKFTKVDQTEKFTKVDQTETFTKVDQTEKFTTFDQTEKFTKVDQTEKFTKVDQTASYHSTNAFATDHEDHPFGKGDSVNNIGFQNLSEQKSENEYCTNNTEKLENCAAKIQAVAITANAKMNEPFSSDGPVNSNDSGTSFDMDLEDSQEMTEDDLEQNKETTVFHDPLPTFGDSGEEKSTVPNLLDHIAHQQEDTESGKNLEETDPSSNVASPPAGKSQDDRLQRLSFTPARKNHSSIDFNSHDMDVTENSEIPELQPFGLPEKDAIPPVIDSQLSISAAAETQSESTEEIDSEAQTITTSCLAQNESAVSNETEPPSRNISIKEKGISSAGSVIKSSSDPGFVGSILNFFQYNKKNLQNSERSVEARRTSKTVKECDEGSGSATNKKSNDRNVSDDTLATNTNGARTLRAPGSKSWLSSKIVNIWRSFSDPFIRESPSDSGTFPTADSGDTTTQTDESQAP